MLAAIEAAPSIVVERARELLTEAISVDEVKGIGDQFEALTLLLRRRKAGLDVQRGAVEIVIHAKRRIGEITSSMDRSPGGRGRTSGKFAQLEALGLSSAEISRCEKLARVPLKRILEHISGVAARSERLTLGGTIAAVSSSSGYAGDEWRSPTEIIVRARRCMGGIDCDPATNAAAQRVIKARVFYTKRDNGLTKQWRGRVWLNSPYSRGLVTAFVAKFLEELESGRMRCGLYLLNASTDTLWFHELAEHLPFVLTKGRLGFAHDAAGGTQDGARQGQVIFAARIARRAFVRDFGDLGLFVPRS